MQDDFVRLKAVQELDDELRTLTGRAEELPGRITRLRDEAERARKDLAETEAALVERRKEYKLAELDLKTSDEKVAQYSVQLYSAKTNEQYKAFLKEIETQKKQKSKVEDRMIVLLEETEALEKKRRAAEKNAAKFASENEHKVSLLEAEQAELANAIAERRAHREEILQALPAAILKLYTRVLNRMGGIAIVATTGERCNGCFNPIPPQRMVEIDRKDKVYTCEACGRILLPGK
ncbi:MAG TPA: hypothetical protein ENN51_07640 [candidate division WOR-3 bacterium]|uniref:C4-type zinc ribbon domain-containing protein n=1 Tax=candidate division WOR-3 bacterium TaxID=2052148 RepID=A0A7V0T798_UNCW3|nr:hypothetical protein [candidate division WOR-3 bacterium]